MFNFPFYLFLLILTIYISICVIQLLYWMLFNLAFRSYKISSIEKNPVAVSIIVCFKNEQNNILKLLDFLCNQDYPNYEIILVDDYSEDATAEYIDAYEDPKIRMVKAEKNIPGKKAALETGISLAANDIIAVTDADCEGTSEWLNLLVSVIPKNGCVLGYAPIYPSESIVSIFASFESWFTGVQYISQAIIGNPYMGVGRNMAFYKSYYWKSGGYKNHEDIISGDDDLMVNAAASPKNTFVQIHPDSFVYSEPPRSLKQFFLQKTRHLKSSFKYNFKDQVLLTTFAGTHMLIYIGIILALFIGNPSYNELIYIFLITLGIKYLFSMIMINKLKTPFLKLFFPIMDILLFFYYTIMVPLIFFKKDETWK